MSYREDFPAVLLVLALGCGGKTGAAPDGGEFSAPSSDGGSSGVSASSGGSGGDGDGGGMSSSGNGSSSSSGSGGSSDSGGDGGVSGIFDAEVPDAFPESCGQFTFALDPDAAPNTCAFTPADVACNTSAECNSYTVNGCGCIEPLYGVNTASTAKCEPPPCPPPLNGCPADASGFKTQDCQLAPDLRHVAVACVNHQCMTYAVGP